MASPDTWRPSRLSTGSWVVYDLANTIFALGIMGLYFPDWLVVQQGRSDTNLSVTIFVAMAIVIVLGPWLGARSDYLGKRTPFLIGTTILAVGATFFFGSVPVFPTLMLLVVALVGVNLGSVVYDALLPDVSTPENRGFVSGLGVAVGYLGSAIALVAGVVMIDRFGYPPYFRTVALLFLVFALPAFFFIKEKPRVQRENPPGMVSALERSMFLMRAWGTVLRTSRM